MLLRLPPPVYLDFLPYGSAAEFVVVGGGSGLMAGRGPIPKDPEKRVRRNKVPDSVELEAGKTGDAPPLPGADGYREETRVWYRTWCESPQGTQFVATDWQRLHMLAPLVDAFFDQAAPADQRQRLLGEIRLNEQRLGATPEDRQRLRWNLRPPAVTPERKPSRRRSDPRLKLVE